MLIGDGDAFAKILQNKSANCKNCNTPIKFGDGVKYAERKGIKGNVVMCSKCMSVFRVELTPAMTLREDVTRQHFTSEDIEKMINEDKKFEKQFYIGCFVVVIIILFVIAALWSKFG